MDNETIMRGCASTAITTLGVVTSFQEQFLWWLRVTSLVVGLVVGLLTIYGIIRRFRSDARAKKEAKEQQ